MAKLPVRVKWRGEKKTSPGIKINDDFLVLNDSINICCTYVLERRTEEVRDRLKQDVQKECFTS